MRAGFADPVLGAQSAFRAAMEATARPGSIQALPVLPDAPPGLDLAAAALLLALADDTTPLWTAAGAEARGWLAFHCGAPFALPAAAAFLLGPPPPLATLGLGSDEAPQDGATLLLPVAALEDDGPLLLRGPGIRGERRLGVAGLPEGFWAARAALAPLAPRGLDVFLCCGARLAALPRSTRVTEAG
ncbi:phosphonate C-P lyase system protein PhnH [Roseococcus sp. DSY-14]|uniref:phosphonate C-P lyase system protein PhnH n=1 Tax=Roseococcus sp. DSY-14 TaxID=3369650 RepID=UPI00387AD0E7